MMDAGNKRILAVFMLAFALHLPGAIYSVWDGGQIIYGITAPERFAYHILAAEESHITISGAQRHMAADICLMPCADCPLDCYDPSILHASCGGSCQLLTEGGKILATHDQKFYAVLKRGILYTGVTFRCYDKTCGFDVELEDGSIFSSHLPKEIEVRD